MIFLKNSNMVHIKKKITLQTSISFPQHISSSWWVNSSLVLFTQLFFFNSVLFPLHCKRGSMQIFAKHKTRPLMYITDKFCYNTQKQHKGLSSLWQMKQLNWSFLDKSEEWDGSDSFLKSNNTKFPSSLFFLCLSH